MRRPVPLKLARSVGLALAAAGLLASAAQAQTATNVAAPAPVKTPGVDAPPLPGTPRPLTVPQFEEATLPNGVRVVVAPSKALPIVSVALHLRLGSAADAPGQAGLASLTNNLRTKGATVAGKPLDATRLAAQAEALGSTLESAADWRGTALTMTVASSKLDAAATLIADATLQPTLADAELQRLREQIIDGLKLSQSDPMALAGLSARRGYWGASVFGGSTTPASLGRITRQEVMSFHKLQLRPELATLVVAGDVTLDRAKALAERLLGSWKGNRMALPQPRQEPASPATPANVMIDLAGAGQAGVVVMAPSVASTAPERRVAQVAGAILGGGYSARLNQEVRIKRGLSYGASAGHDFQPVGSVLSAQTQTNNATAGQVVELLRGEIVRMGQGLAAPEELAARQATLVGNYGRQIETTAGLAGLAIDLIGRERPLSDAQRYAPDVMAVSAEQVRDYAAKHWTAPALRSLVVGDLGAAGDSLKAAMPGALVLKSDQLDLEAPGLKKP